MRLYYAAVLLLLFSLLLFNGNSVSAFSINSSSYASYVDVGIGSLLSSSNYSSQAVIEDIIGNISSSNYKANFGFLAGIAGAPSLLVSLNYPGSGASLSSSSVNFNWTAIGINPVCNLTIDNVINASGVASPNGTAVNYTVFGISDGAHTWNVSCFGSLGSFNSSARSFSIDTTVPPGAPSGGGGAVSPEVIENILINTSEINLDMTVGSTKERIVRIINKGKEGVEISILQQNLDASFSDNFFVLRPNEYKDVKIKINAPEEAGIYTGRININGKIILVSLNVRSGPLLFDVSIIVPESYKRIKPGKNLRAQITLIPMGDKLKVDVTLGYVIKDFDGKTYTQESETILVTKQKNFEKEFLTSILPLGDYVVGLEVIYPNGVATSSSHFSIVEKIPFSSSKKLFIAVSALVIAALVGFIIIRYKRLRRLRIK